MKSYRYLRRKIGRKKIEQLLIKHFEVTKISYFDDLVIIYHDGQKVMIQQKALQGWARINLLLES